MASGHWLRGELAHGGPGFGGRRVQTRHVGPARLAVRGSLTDGVHQELKRAKRERERRVSRSVERTFFSSFSSFSFSFSNRAYVFPSLAGANVQGVDRSQMEPAFLVLWSSSTKSSLKMEGDERRLVHGASAPPRKGDPLSLSLSLPLSTHLERGSLSLFQSLVARDVLYVSSYWKKAERERERARARRVRRGARERQSLRETADDQRHDSDERRYTSSPPRASVTKWSTSTSRPNAKSNSQPSPAFAEHALPLLPAPFFPIAETETETERVSLSNALARCDLKGGERGRPPREGLCRVSRERERERERAATRLVVDRNTHTRLVFLKAKEQAGKETPLPALTFGAHYHGPFQTIQERAMRRSRVKNTHVGLQVAKIQNRENTGWKTRDVWTSSSSRLRTAFLHRKRRRVAFRFTARWSVGAFSPLVRKRAISRRRGLLGAPGGVGSHLFDARGRRPAGHQRGSLLSTEKKSDASRARVVT